MHEQQIAARSWAEECIQTVMRITGGKIIKLDQCEFGLTSVGDDGVEKPARKTTGMLTNSPAIRLTLARRCKKDHEHTQLIGGGRCRKAQAYPIKLCEAIVEGGILQKRWDKMRQKVIVNIQSENGQEEYKDTERAVPPEEQDWEE